MCPIDRWINRETRADTVFSASCRSLHRHRRLASGRQNCSMVNRCGVIPMRYRCLASQSPRPRSCMVPFASKYPQRQRTLPLIRGACNRHTGQVHAMLYRPVHRDRTWPVTQARRTIGRCLGHCSAHRCAEAVNTTVAWFARIPLVCCEGAFEARCTGDSKHREPKANFIWACARQTCQL
jgi:hypothetical protein